jgi:DNA-directed RNA polymerase specialized sigma24 family protein
MSTTENDGAPGWDDRAIRLALRAHAGDRAARNDLYMLLLGSIRRMERRAQRYLRSVSWRHRGGAPLSPEDISQEAFVVFCDLVETWQPSERAFDDYLRARLPSRLLHYVRDTLFQDRAGVHDDAEDGGVESIPAASAPSPERTEWEDYLSGFSALSPYLAERLTLRYFSDRSAEQIALAFGQDRRKVYRDLEEARSVVAGALRPDRDSCGPKGS